LLELARRSAALGLGAQEGDDIEDFFLREAGPERTHLRALNAAGDVGVERAVAAAVTEASAGEARTFRASPAAAVAEHAALGETTPARLHRISTLGPRVGIVRKSNAATTAHYNEQRDAGDAKSGS